MDYIQTVLPRRRGLRAQGLVLQTAVWGARDEQFLVDSGALPAGIQEAFPIGHDDGDLGPFNFSESEMELLFLHRFRRDATPAYTVQFKIRGKDAYLILKLTLVTHRRPFCSAWTGSVIPCFTCVDVVIGVFIVYWSVSVVSSLSLIGKSFMFPAGCSRLRSKFKLFQACFS